MASDTVVVVDGAAVADARLLQEIQLLREGLWACYAMAGGDPQQYAADAVNSADLVPLVLDCVHDLRGLFEAARRDMR